MSRVKQQSAAPAAETSSVQRRRPTKRSGPQNSGPQKRAPEPPKPLWYRLRWLLLSLPLLCLLVWMLGNRKGEILGVVRDKSTQTVLINARIQLDGGEAIVANEETRQFSFRGIEAGTHELLIKAPGFEEQHQRLEIGVGQSQRLEVSLRALPVVDQSLRGDLLISAERDPNLLVVRDAEFKPLKTLPLPYRPTAGLVNGEVAFLLDSGQDMISVVDLHRGAELRRITLPPYSGPQRLLLTPDQRQLVVLNSVAKNLTLVDLQSDKQQRIELPSAPSDMKLATDGSSVLLAGPAGFLRVSLAGTVSTELPFGLGRNGGLSVLPNGQALLPAGSALNLVNAPAGQGERIELSAAPVAPQALDSQASLQPASPQAQMAPLAEQLAVLDSDRILIAGAGRIWRYRLSLRSPEGEPFKADFGEVTQMERFGSRILMSTRTGLWLVEPDNLAASRQLTEVGQTQFVLSHHLP